MRRCALRNSRLSLLVWNWHWHARPGSCSWQNVLAAASSGDGGGQQLQRFLLLCCLMLLLWLPSCLQRLQPALAHGRLSGTAVSVGHGTRKMKQADQGPKAFQSAFWGHVCSTAPLRNAMCQYWCRDTDLHGEAPEHCLGIDARAMGSDSSSSFSILSSSPASLCRHRHQSAYRDSQCKGGGPSTCCTGLHPSLVLHKEIQAAARPWTARTRTTITGRKQMMYGGSIPDGL